MTLTIDLDTELEHRLDQLAKEQGVPAATVTVRLLDEHLPKAGPGTSAAALLRSWRLEGDAEEQRETGEYLIRALDEDRLSDRKLFPPELKGISW